MEKKFNRILSLVLALIMVIGLMPVGHIHVHAEGATETKATYRWELIDGQFKTAPGYTPNALTANDGTIAEDGTMSGMAFALADEVNLKAGEEWSVKFEIVGTEESAMLLSGTEDTSNYQASKAFYLWVKPTQVSLGNYKVSSAATNNNAFKTVSSVADSVNTYLLYNTVTTAEDGTVSNAVYLKVNDAEAIAMHASDSANYWPGNDIVVRAFGAGTKYYLDCKLNYVEIYIPSAAAHTCEYTIAGETVDSTSCSTSGYTVMACECGNTTNVANGVYAAHTYGDWANNDGVISRTCSACGDVQTGDYVWQVKNQGIYDVKNDVNLELQNGSIAEDGTMNSVQSNMTESVELPYDSAWTIEWTATGKLQTCFLLATEAASNEGNQYIYVQGTDNGANVMFGRRWKNDSGSVVHDNAAAAAINGYTGTHTYRIVNEVTVDDNGDYVSNAPYLYVDGVKINKALSGSANNSKEIYPCGTTLTFGTIGTYNNAGKYPLNGFILDYILIDVPHVCRYTTEQQIVAGDNCQDNGHTVMACECGKTKNVENEVKGNHEYGAFGAVAGVLTRTCQLCQTTQTASYAYVMQGTEGSYVMAEYSVSGSSEAKAEEMTPYCGEVTSEGVLSGVRYQIDTVTLKHDEAWSIEWRSSGNFTKDMLLSSAAVLKPENQINAYIARWNDGTFHLGYYDAVGGAHTGTGATVAFDTSVDTTFRVENRVTTGESGEYVSNEIYIVVENLGIAEKLANSSFYNDVQDLEFSYIGGANDWTLDNIALKYLIINVPEVEVTCEHQYDNACDATCNVEGCDYTREVEHSWDEGVYTEGNCKTPGCTIYTCTVDNCAETKTEYDAENGDHSYKLQSSETGENCHTAGQDYYTCEYCGAEKYEANTLYGVHETGDLVETVAGDCQTKGYKKYTCIHFENCGEHVIIENETYGDHVYDNDCDATCNVEGCDNTREVEDHNYEVISNVAGDDCQQMGVITYQCSICKAEYTEQGNFGAHSWDEGVHTDGDCRTYGYTTYTCTVENCEETKTEADTEYGAHSWGEGVHTDGNCQNYGYTTYTCTVENCEEFKSEYDAAFGAHSFGDWTVDTLTTELKRTCTIDGCEESEEAALGVQTDDGWAGYDNLADAISAAANSRIVLFEDAQIDNLIVNNGHYLDLNGHKLTADYVFVGQDSAIFCGRYYTNEHLLIVAKNQLIIEGNNLEHLPIWTDNGYIFTAVQNYREMTDTSTENTTKFYFLPEFRAKDLELLKQGKDASGVQIKIYMYFNKDDTAKTVKLTFSDKYDDLIKRFCEGYDADTGVYAQAFRLTVTGTDLIDEGSLSFEVVLVTDCGAEISLYPRIII